MKYQLPGSRPGSKTVYDPAKYPDMPKLVDAAGLKALLQYSQKGMTGNQAILVDLGGIRFNVQVNSNASKGLPPNVPTAYPKELSP